MNYLKLETPAEAAAREAEELRRWYERAKPVRVDWDGERMIVAATGEPLRYDSNGCAIT